MVVVVVVVGGGGGGGGGGAAAAAVTLMRTIWIMAAVWYKMIKGSIVCSL